MANNNMNLRTTFIKVYLEYEEQQLRFLNAAKGGEAQQQEGVIPSRAATIIPDDEIESLGRLTESAYHDDIQEIHEPTTSKQELTLPLESQKLHGTSVERSLEDLHDKQEGPTSIKRRIRIS